MVHSWQTVLEKLLLNSRKAQGHSWRKHLSAQSAWWARLQDNFISEQTGECVYGLIMKNILITWNVVLKEDCCISPNRIWANWQWVGFQILSWIYSTFLYILYLWVSKQIWKCFWHVGKKYILLLQPVYGLNFKTQLHVCWIACTKYVCSASRPYNSDHVIYIIIKLNIKIWTNK